MTRDIDVPPGMARMPLVDDDGCDASVVVALPRASEDPIDTGDEVEQVANIGEVATHHTDVGNGRRFALVNADAFRHIVDSGQWLHWDDRIWAVATRGDLHRAAKQVASLMLQKAAAMSDEDSRSKAVKFALASENEKRLKAMITMAASEPLIETDVSALDRDPFLLAARNGTIDLRTGQLREHRQQDLITRACPVRYDASATAPRFEQFLTEVFADRADVIAFVQRAIGYTLTGDTSAQCLFLLHGSGSNGKSVLVDTLVRLLGDHAITSPFQTFVRKPLGESIPNDLAMMRGARMVSASEGEDGARFSVARVKSLTGGDIITARFMRGEWFSYRPAFKLWLSTNHLPQIKETGNAIWRRIRLIPFEVAFEGERRDDKLGVKLWTERTGIFAWAVRGAVAWHEAGGGLKGLGTSETIAKATAGYKTDSDVVGRFIGERCSVLPAAGVYLKALYAAYADWCKESGIKPVNNIELGKAMAVRGFKAKHRGTGNYHEGIGLPRFEAE